MWMESRKNEDHPWMIYYRYRFVVPLSAYPLIRSSLCTLFSENFLSLNSQSLFQICSFADLYAVLVWPGWHFISQDFSPPDWSLFLWSFKVLPCVSRCYNSLILASIFYEWEIVYQTYVPYLVEGWTSHWGFCRLCVLATGRKQCWTFVGVPVPFNQWCSQNTSQGVGMADPRLILTS